MAATTAFELSLLFVSSRSCTILIEDGGVWETARPYALTLNGESAGSADRCVHSLYGLLPGTAYTLTAACEGGEQTLAFTTAAESVTLDVRRFGALGDGCHDDTPAIQAAILTCPDGGRVLVPAGDYRVGPLFLKSHMTLHLARGTRLALRTEREAFPILPGIVRSDDGAREDVFSLYEGNPLDTFAAAITGMGVEDVRIIGEGTVDGCAQDGDWWQHTHTRTIAWRGNLFFLRGCKNITVQGIHFANSPCWNLHPFMSEHLDFFNIEVTAPWNSPNTDAFDPESCQHVRLIGARLSVGDDCIALKAGKIWMGQTYGLPCEDIEIRQCLMEDGHGAVTVGSEMAGGVKHVRVSQCLMRATDRGLRVKTRRGRGKNGVIDDIVFERVRMDHVKAPLVLNSLYYCDPDGHSDYVQCREKLPVDDRTPTIGTVVYRDVEAEGCEACAAYLLGLPERPVEEVRLERCSFRFDPDAKPMVPAMADGVAPCALRGVVAGGVKKLVLDQVRMEGNQAPDVESDKETEVVRTGG